MVVRNISATSTHTQSKCPVNTSEWTTVIIIEKEKCEKMIIKKLKTLQV